MTYYVYALYNHVRGMIYIGQTNNIEHRIEEHNKKRGNHFTAIGIGKWVIVYKEECKNRTEALKREKQLKSFRGREFIKKFINSPVAQR